MRAPGERIVGDGSGRSERNLRQFRRNGGVITAEQIPESGSKFFENERLRRSTGQDAHADRSGEGKVDLRRADVTERIVADGQRMRYGNGKDTRRNVLQVENGVEQVCRKRMDVVADGQRDAVRRLSAVIEYEIVPGKVLAGLAVIGDACQRETIGKSVASQMGYGVRQRKSGQRNASVVCVSAHARYSFGQDGSARQSRTSRERIGRYFRQSRRQSKIF